MQLEPVSPNHPSPGIRLANILASKDVKDQFAPRSSLWAMIVQRVNLLGAAGWVTGTFTVQQVLRLATSVVLARLLAPELLGTMVLINALRTGGELLTDLGIGQSVVKDPRGDDPVFYNTAWTIQIIRGVILFVAALLVTVPLSHVYQNSQLLYLLPLAASMFVINGFSSPASYLLQKRLALRQLALYSAWTAVASSAIHIALAMLTPTIWALVGGLLISAVISVVGSYFLMDNRNLAFRFDKQSRDAILHFGKWVFASSIIYFAAMNFDRLYFAKAVPLAVLGVYGIARTLADTISLLTQRLGTLVVFPKVSSSQMGAADLRDRILPLRRVALVFLAIGLAGAVALSDKFIFVTYDVRYRAAAVYLPVMLIGTWFSILASFADAMLMGIGKPSNVAFANAAKLLTVLLIVPQVLHRGGMLAAVCAFAAAELVRYGVLVVQKRAAGLAFSKQDIAATLMFVCLVIFWREVTALVGLTGGLGSWAAQVRGALA